MSEEDKIKISDEDKVISVDKEGVEITRENYKDEIKKESTKIFDFFKTKKGQWFLVGILLLAIIIFGSWIRLQNLPLLKDSTTGEYIPLALDPYYFLRVAETIVDNGGVLPTIDSMRVLEGGAEFTNEILPKAVILLWKCANVFGDYSIQYIHNLYPVIFFILGLVVYFFLISYLTNSKIIALLSSFLIAIIPSYLYRTMAGFSDHEAIGMFAFFLTLLVYSVSMNYLEKQKEYTKKNQIKIYILGLCTAFATALTIASWGGVSKFIFMIIPLSFLIFWVINSEDNKKLHKYIIYYGLWFLFTFVFVSFFGFSIIGKFKATVLTSSGILSGFVLGFILVDYLMIKAKSNLIRINENLIKYRIFYSVLATIILGLIFLIVSGQDILSLMADLIERLLNPFGRDRLGLTVAENKQPYLNGWIAQTGKAVFYLFLVGMFFIGANVSKGIKKLNHKILFNMSWIVLVLGIVYSRISPSSILNGNNFLSGLFYFGGLIFFIISFIYIYLQKDIKINLKLIIILSTMFFILIAGRGAIRLFFVTTPFVCFMSSYALINLFNYAKRSREELMKWGAYMVFGILLVALISGSIGAAKSSIQQGKYTGPSANLQWQKAMKWVRENTNEDSIFAHWWDYGYWVEYLGERPVISDGGHFQGTFRDHLIGRYILTNPSPESAMSFLKSNNVSYLLIDQTDIGKYSAYSSIGSDTKWDRMSTIPTLNSNPSEIQETSTGEIRVYNGASGVGDDIIYEKNGTTIFLPGATFDKFGSPNYKSFMIGIILEIDKSNSNESFVLKQPQGVFVYEGKQIKIPLRYVYYQEKEIDFGKGLEAGIKIIPRAYSSEAGLQIDYLGSAFYFNQRTINSLFVQLFLLNNLGEQYPTVKLVHSEDYPIVKDLKSQGISLEDFLVYQGIHGPIKIFKVEYSDDILINEEFLRVEGEWGEFDKLEVIKIPLQK